MNEINTQNAEIRRANLEKGTHKDDRTGTGTTSIFGYQTRFDLAKEFPLVTTKKVFTKGAVEELFWFLKGSISSRDLEAKGVNIWREWADEQGELGPVYGYVWRYAPSSFTDDVVAIPIKKDELDGWEDDYEGERQMYGVGYYTDEDIQTIPRRVVDEWKHIMEVCYSPESVAVSEGEAHRNTVHPYWHSLRRFHETLHRVPLYPLWKEMPGRYSLNANYYGATQFSPNTSIFVTHDIEYEISENTGAHLAYQDESGRLFLSRTDASRHALESNPEGSQVAFDEIKLSEVKPPEGHLWRRKLYVDQVEWLLNEIRTNPDSRRLIISAWNPDLTDRQALPPCHTLFQFYVADGKLSCQLYQRSMDAFLGCPFNYVGYALFVHMIAQQTGLEVGEFVHTIGDAHIYDNHREQIELQLSREVRPMPTLKLNKAESLYDYKLEDVEIVGYDPHPAIRGEVAV